MEAYSSWQVTTFTAHSCWQAKAILAFQPLRLACSHIHTKTGVDAKRITASNRSQRLEVTTFTGHCALQLARGLYEIMVSNRSLRLQHTHVDRSRKCWHFNLSVSPVLTYTREQGSTQCALQLVGWYCSYSLSHLAQVNGTLWGRGRCYQGLHVPTNDHDETKDKKYFCF